uniref:Reverse transcriptase domain-containing protein n=1 Tax=Tanacetum cinerariifolium TaxID=118510 RepID=A0A6L2LM09_TANCI|nr:reverse transcriptase domain-containing protein [Tanacetum cinerariifolium]
MRTRSSAINLFPPLDNPELTIQRRSRVDPTLLNDFKMATEGYGDPPVLDLQTMEELCQPSLNGRGGPIDPIAIQVTNFRLKNDMIQKVQNSCQFHGLPGDDANKHLDKFLHVTQSIKVNGVTDDALRLYLFPYSLTHHGTAWFDHFPRISINAFEQIGNMFLRKYFPPSMLTKLRNEITNFRQHTFYNGLTLRRRDTINATAGGTFMKRHLEECYDLIKNMTAHHNDWDTSAQRSESSSSITSSSDQEIVALKAKMAEINKNLIKVLQINQQVKVVTPSCETCGGPHSYNDCPATVGRTQNVYDVRAYQGSNSYQPQVVTATEFTNYMKANDAILKNMQTNMTSLTNSNLELKNMFGQFMKMNTASSLGLGTLPSNTITNPKEDLKGITATAYQGPMIPTTSSSLPKVVERETEVTKDTVPPTKNRSIKDVQPPVVQIETSIPNSEPVDAPVIKPVAAPVSAPKPNQKPSIPYPSRFQDQKLCDKTNDQKEKFFKIFQDLNFNISFADALILMPKFGPSIKSLLTNKDKLYELARTPEWMNAWPWPISVRSFLKTEKALIDVYEGELTLHVGKEAITFTLDQTSRYAANYNDMTVNRIDVIDMACEEYSQEVLGFSYVIASGNPTLYYDLIVSTSSPTLTSFEDSDFLLEEVNLSQVRKELKICEAKNDKSSIDKPPKVELKDLPPHLEYEFLEGDDKFPVIIAKDLSIQEKAALIKVLKEHKQAIAWKLSDIKGIDPEFYTHKILMEDDFEPAVQHQRRVNPKTHDVIKKEVLKLLDAGLIYPIPDSPWVSPVHCVPKKGGFTVVENEENELISTRLVTGWRVYIDYRKLTEATRKDHFPLPFMDQMLERLARNQYYCFLDGFSGYFQILIDLKDQENTTFTCPYGTFAYRHMPFGLCNAPGKFQRCMMAIFHDMIEKRWKSSWTTSRSLGIHSELVSPIWKRCFNGSFLSSRGNKYILVAVDYLSTWVEAKALPTNDARVVCKFLKSLFSRFGTPRTIISDHGTYFYNDQFAKVMLKYGVTHRLATTYHPQTNGQVEVSNHGLKRILERTMGENRASWSDRLDDALWAFRITFKTPIGCTSYKLVYRKACHLPIELEHKAYWALNHASFDLQTAGDHRKVQLNELNELRDQAYETL